MTSPSQTSVDHHPAADHQPAVAGDNADMLDRSPELVAQMLAEDPQPAAPAEGWDPAATAVGSPADEPDVTGRGDAERSMTAVVPHTEPEPCAVSATASPSMHWHEIQAMFVDDPRSSAEMAASLVDDSIQALVAYVKEQQDSLHASWHGQDAGTEELRTAVQHYRAFGTRLSDFPRET
jgi:hypothetical protein